MKRFLFAVCVSLFVVGGTAWGMVVRRTRYYDEGSGSGVAR